LLPFLNLTLPTEDNKKIHLRTTTQAEAGQKQLYAALSIQPDPIGKFKTTIDNKKTVVPFELKPVTCITVSPTGKPL
jgi:hypothetical protein